MKRRDFLRASAAGGAAALGSSVWTRRANAAAFGETPNEHVSSMLPEPARAQSILECFLYGGLIPWETFYCVPEFGASDETWAYTNYAYMMKAAEGCGFDTSEPFVPFGNDSSGRTIYFGPYMKKLLARPDILARMRIVINRHTLAPHEAAIPLVASGRSLGNPSLAGLATHVGRYFVDRDVEGSHPPPFSYGFATGSSFLPNDGVYSLVAQGLHPGQARPLLVKVDNAARLNTLLARTTVGTLPEREQYDALLGLYFEQYQKRLSLGSASEVVRAAKFQELLQASKTVAKTDIIQGVFNPSLFEAMPGSSCYQVNGTVDAPVLAQNPLSAATNIPGMSLRLATHLLTHPTFPARHCTVVDTGLIAADGGGGYDTHSNGPWRQASNFNNFLDNLLSRINTPGEGDPSKIDLDKTMVILNSEFGRAPGRQGTGQGRNHWPHGFPQIYIGGPIGTAQAGIYGSIGEDGMASTYTTPAENRIAALLALGIWPFDEVAYSGSDAQGQTQEAPAARSIIKRILGHEV
ncbi:MAG TPA: DUF1501 domain-containing protein [Polyangiaceae bacterium]|nr:DUF1501 domain-containing protein [Polyangiaceae bacterium]